MILRPALAEPVAQDLAMLLRQQVVPRTFRVLLGRRAVRDVQALRVEQDAVPLAPRAVDTLSAARRRILEYRFNMLRIVQKELVGTSARNLIRSHSVFVIETVFKHTII